MHAFGSALVVSCSRAQVYDVFMTRGGGRDDVMMTTGMGMMATGMMVGVISGPVLGRRCFPNNFVFRTIPP